MSGLPGNRCGALVDSKESGTVGFGALRCRSDEQLLDDDENLATGRFQFVGDRYIYVLE